MSRADDFERLAGAQENLLHSADLDARVRSAADSMREFALALSCLEEMGDRCSPSMARQLIRAQTALHDLQGLVLGKERS